jgi:hypothetical protein
VKKNSALEASGSKVLQRINWEQQERLQEEVEEQECTCTEKNLPIVKDEDEKMRSKRKGSELD